MSIQTSPPSERSVFIAGGRSWIGYHLTNCLEALHWQVSASSSQPSAAGFSKLATVQDVDALLSRASPAVIVNLLIGIDEEHWKIHQAFLRWAQENKAHYIYASSALALDAYRGEPLHEEMPANAVSEYGRFKARCEGSLHEARSLDASILRFASIHGWSPYKDTRTEVLLRKVAAGETIEVSPGVIQNRLTDTILCSAIANIVDRRELGTFHLGPVDSSEEIEFLRSLATAFGHSDSGITAGEQRDVNLVVIPGAAAARIDLETITEKQCLARLCERSELSQHKHTTATSLENS